MYRIAQRVVGEAFDEEDYNDLTDGLGVLLLTWNQAFYRYGSFDFDRLEEVLRDHWGAITGLRARDVASFAPGEEEASVRHLFAAFLDALRIAVDNKMNGRQSPVAVAKTLHLLAPRFFPLWDVAIARAYGCLWQGAVTAPRHYAAFMEITKQSVDSVAADYARITGCPEEESIPRIEQELMVGGFHKPILKLIDEYNYSRYTQGWIE